MTVVTQEHIDRIKKAYSHIPPEGNLGTARQWLEDNYGVRSFALIPPHEREEAVTRFENAFPARRGKP